MNIEYEAKKASTRIIEWCYLKDREGLDENLPTKVIEELLKQNEKEMIDKACEWLKDHAQFTKRGEIWGFDVESFRKAMEE